MDSISNTTGGAYIPPSKLRLMQEKITDKSSEAYQKLAWDALKKTINGLINKINVDNFNIIVKKLLSENIIRGRGILARTIIVAQSDSPALTHVHAALVAVINSKFPQVGLLIVHRLLNDFKKSYKRNDKKRCLTCSRFFAHLFNQNVVDFVIIMEILCLMVDAATNNSVETAVSIMKEVGLKIEEQRKAVSMALFDKFRFILNEGTLDKRVNYMIEVLFQIRKDKYKDYPIVKEGLNLDQDDQTTHVIDLLTDGDIHDELNIFQFDPNFLEMESRYEEMKEEILPESEDDGDDDDEENDEQEEGPVMTVDIQDQSFLSTVELRRKIYLKIHSALTFLDAAHLLLQIPLKPEQLYEMASMILDCCAQLRIYDNKFGYLAQQMCLVNHKYVEEFEKLFCENYSGIHRLDMTKIRNMAMFFAHLICKDTVSWGIFVIVKITEKDTTSSGRIFLKHLFQEMRCSLGLDVMIARFKEEEMQVYFQNIFPKDDLKDTKFSINFFTAIDLGKITVDMRKFFEEAKTAKLDDGPDKKRRKKKDNDSSSESSSSSDSSSESSSESSRSRKNPNKKRSIDRKANKNDGNVKKYDEACIDVRKNIAIDSREDRFSSKFDIRQGDNMKNNPDERSVNDKVSQPDKTSSNYHHDRRDQRSRNAAGSNNFDDHRDGRSINDRKMRPEERNANKSRDERDDRDMNIKDDRTYFRDSKNYHDKRDERDRYDKDSRPYDRDTKNYRDEKNRNEKDNRLVERKPISHPDRRDERDINDKDNRPYDRDSKNYRDKRDERDRHDKDSRPYDRDSKNYRDEKNRNEKDNRLVERNDISHRDRIDERDINDQDNRPYVRDSKNYRDKRDERDRHDKDSRPYDRDTKNYRDEKNKNEKDNCPDERNAISYRDRRDESDINDKDSRPCGRDSKNYCDERNLEDKKDERDKNDKDNRSRNNTDNNENYTEARKSIYYGDITDDSIVKKHDDHKKNVDDHRKKNCGHEGYKDDKCERDVDTRREPINQDEKKISSSNTDKIMAKPESTIKDGRQKSAERFISVVSDLPREAGDEITETLLKIRETNMTLKPKENKKHTEEKLIDNSQDDIRLATKDNKSVKKDDKRVKRKRSSSDSTSSSSDSSSDSSSSSSDSRGKKVAKTKDRKRRESSSSSRTSDDRRTTKEVKKEKNTDSIKADNKQTVDEVERMRKRKSSFVSSDSSSSDYEHRRRQNKKHKQ